MGDITPKQAMFLQGLLNKIGPWTPDPKFWVEQAIERTIEDFDDLSKIEASQLIGAIVEQTQDFKTVKTYTIRVQSPFFMTPTQVKTRLGIGYKVLSVETERDIPPEEIKDVDSAVTSIIRTGYRALARAHHPDVGGDTAVMSIITRAKKELEDLLKGLA